MHSVPSFGTAAKTAAARTSAATLSPSAAKIHRDVECAVVWPIVHTPLLAS
ncbi:unnamed protein product [Anisakis simplex]|uniref:Uncharacterized protein n=1 Tax=Anisakis simplex TaxID=6269 RepID=A0A3P6NRQ3_ANISI|nr:unnamed protein product [Anisakis simplex]